MYKLFCMFGLHLWEEQPSVRYKFSSGIEGSIYGDRCSVCGRWRQGDAPHDVYYEQPEGMRRKTGELYYDGFTLIAIVED